MLSRRGRGRFALRVLGLGFVAVGGVATGFALVGGLTGLSWRGFTAMAVVGFLLGILGLAGGGGRVEPSRREALFSVLALWLTLPIVGTLPYTLDGGMGFINALFESMSGFTATGATALADFTQFDRGLMAWRSLSQWFGGVGIIVLFLAVFPQLAIAGRSLFNTEMPGPTEERLAPRLRNTAGAVLAVYLGLTAAIGVGFLATGMQAYDALLHAWTTVAAGGFSPQPRSFEAFTPGVQWVAIAGMLLAGVSFALQFRAWGGRPGVLLRDAELRAYAAIVLASGLGLAFLLGGWSGSLREGLFHAISILTTTGFASQDFALWDNPPKAILVALMFVGGSAGSAAGGIKIVRLLIVAKNTSREVRKTLHPRAVLPIRVGGRIVPDDVLRSVAAFVTLYVSLFAFSTLALGILGVDFVTAFTASIATVGNVGPGLGMVGPMGSYADLPSAAKLLLTFNMYAGRLEVVTLFVVFTGDWWKIPREWRRR